MNNQIHAAWETRMIKGIFAHRGLHNKPVVPENSLPAFKAAIDMGYGAELDVHLIKDGSLVVFHDSLLKRCTGSEGVIEDLTLSEVKELRLEGTGNTIPTFDEVLNLFEKATPLIIELKSYNGNYKELAAAVCQRLDSYKGEFCIESFDPRAMLEVKKLRPNIFRGQLIANFFKDKNADVSFLEKIILTNLMFNALVQADFIACKFADRNLSSVKNAITKGAQAVYWTIDNQGDFEECIKENAIPIFERFIPMQN